MPLGNLVGGTLGFLLARLTQQACPYPLITGGMPSGRVAYKHRDLRVHHARSGCNDDCVVADLDEAATTGIPMLYDLEVSNGKPDRRPETFRLDASRHRKTLARCSTIVDW